MQLNPSPRHTPSPPNHPLAGLGLGLHLGSQYKSTSNVTPSSSPSTTTLAPSSLGMGNLGTQLASLGAPGGGVSNGPLGSLSGMGPSSYPGGINMAAARNESPSPTSTDESRYRLYMYEREGTWAEASVNTQSNWIFPLTISFLIFALPLPQIEKLSGYISRYALAESSNPAELTKEKYYDLINIAIHLMKVIETLDPDKLKTEVITVVRFGT